jgi:hypothetical protein
MCLDGTDCKLGLAVTAFCTYFIIGFFGAARWGASTAGDILENEWGERYYNGILNVLLAGEGGHEVRQTNQNVAETNGIGEVTYYKWQKRGIVPGRACQANEPPFMLVKSPGTISLTLFDWLLYFLTWSACPAYLCLFCSPV